MAPAANGKCGGAAEVRDVEWQEKWSGSSCSCNNAAKQPPPPPKQQQQQHPPAVGKENAEGESGVWQPDAEEHPGKDLDYT